MRMMTSVSMLARRSGAAGPVILVKGCTSQSPDVGDLARDSGGDSHRRARQMGAGVRTLPPDKIPVRGRNRACSGRHAFPIGSDTHAATRLPPLESRTSENGIEALRLGISLHPLRPRNDPRCHALRDVTTAS